VGDLSSHFSRREFACRCGCGEFIICEELIELLEEIRRRYGDPIVITSGYRCQKHNEAVGGSESSYHRIGQAADIAPTNIPYEQRLRAQARLCLAAKESLTKAGTAYGGLGLAPGRFIHVD
jgi:uncharacterized protein YcbK (DUF882 family)